MKKIIATTVLAASLAGTCAFGQGWLQLQSGTGQVYDGFTTAATSVSPTAATVNFALYWAASAANPMPGSLVNSITTGTSATTAVQAGYTVATAWSDLLGSSYTLATEGANSGNPGQQVISVNDTSSGAGVLNYINGNGFSITGTTAGQTVNLLLLGWSSAYASASAAQSAGAAIGWSYASGYALATSGTDFNIQSPTFNNFGVFAPSVAAVPEPSSLALAGLGGFGMLMAFRRKKA